jgi:hypothetical protein
MTGHNDDHIIRLIGRRKLKQLFVGIYGDEDNERQSADRAEGRDTPRYAAKDAPTRGGILRCRKHAVWG